MPIERVFWTPPEVARRLRCSPEKILRLIRAGQIRALNIAENRAGKRSRFLVSEDALIEFAQLREVQAAPKLLRKRQRPPTDVIEFF